MVIRILRRNPKVPRAGYLTSIFSSIFCGCFGFASSTVFFVSFQSFKHIFYIWHFQILSYIVYWSVVFYQVGPIVIVSAPLRYFTWESVILVPFVFTLLPKQMVYFKQVTW
jgi:hypothetical protein